MSLFTADELPHYLYLRFLAKESANAFSLTAARELSALTTRYKKWKKPVVVSSAHPRVFCSGGNLSDYKKLHTKAEGLKVNREIGKAIETFAAWKAVKIAVVNGDVLGGGMEWLARFDFRWSTPTPLFSFWQRRIGLSPGWGGGSCWAQRIGEAQLRQLLVEAAPLPALAAQRLGFIDRIVLQWQVADDLEHFTRGLDCEAVLAANSWTTKSEAKIFSDLWLADEHSKVLKSWK